MRNVNLNFLPHPKTTEMLLLSNFQYLAREIFILKTQDLSQQKHQCPETNFQNLLMKHTPDTKERQAQKTALHF